MPYWADAIQGFIRPDFKPYYGVDRTLDEIPDFGVAQPKPKPKPRPTPKKSDPSPMGYQAPFRRVKPTRRGSFPKKKPMKRTSTKKRKVLKRKRVAPRRGKFKKPRKVRKIGTKYHNHRYEQEGTANAGQPFMYVGVNDCFNREAIWDAMADAIIRPILAKEFKFRPLQDTDRAPNVGGTSTGAPMLIVFDFKRVTAITGADEILAGLGSDAAMSAARVDVDNEEYQSIRARMSSLLQTFADATRDGSGNASVTPVSDKVAYYPCAYRTIGYQSATASAAESTVLSHFEHMGDTSVDLIFSQTTRFVNRTLAEGGGAEGQNLDRLGTHPLKGMLYQFNGSAPRIHEHVDMTPALRLAMQKDTVKGIDMIVSSDAADTHLAHPLSAKFWLKNCTKQASIYLAPGASKSHSTVTKIKGKLSTIIERFYFSGFDKGTFGNSSMFMFDMVDRTAGQTPATVYKRSCMVKAAGRLRTPKLYIPDFEAEAYNLA